MVSIATFMEVLDTSIANVALHHIAGSLAASYDESTWVLTSYLVANAIVLPISGWLSDVIGRKRFYMICVALFTRQPRCCAGSRRTCTLLIIVRASCRASAAAAWRRASRRCWPTPSRRDKRGMAFALYGIAVVVGADHRADARRLDHRQLLLALDLLHQRARSASLSLFLVQLARDRARGARARARERCRAALRSTGSASCWWRSSSAAWRSCSTAASATTGSASASSRFFATCRSCSFVFIIPWELTRKEPIVDLGCSASATSASAFADDGRVGVVLFGTTPVHPAAAADAFITTRRRCRAWR